MLTTSVLTTLMENYCDGEEAHTYRTNAYRYPDRVNTTPTFTIHSQPVGDVDRVDQADQLLAGRDIDHVDQNPGSVGPGLQRPESHPVEVPPADAADYKACCLNMPGMPDGEKDAATFWEATMPGSLVDGHTWKAVGARYKPAFIKFMEHVRDTTIQALIPVMAKRNSLQAWKDKVMLKKYIQAVGLASTLAGDMVVNVDDPVGMMKEVERRIHQDRDALEQTRVQLAGCEDDLIHWRERAEQAEADLTIARAQADDACELVAKMHKEVWNETRGPARGVVEDVTDLRLRAEQAEAEAELASLRSQPPRYIGVKPRSEWPLWGSIYSKAKSLGDRNDTDTDQDTEDMHAWLADQILVPVEPAKPGEREESQGVGSPCPGLQDGVAAGSTQPTGEWLADLVEAAVAITKTPYGNQDAAESAAGTLELRAKDFASSPDSSLDVAKAVACLRAMEAIESREIDGVGWAYSQDAFSARRREACESATGNTPLAAIQAAMKGGQ